MKSAAKDLDDILESLDEMRVKLRDIDHKMDHLIKNLRQFNGRNYPSHSHTSDFTD